MINIRATKWYSVLFFAQLVCVSLFAQSSTLWGDLKPGPYAVGFRVVNTNDSSRRVERLQSARPLQISVWYPAHRSEHHPTLHYKDYFLLSASELKFEPLQDSAKDTVIKQYKDILKSNGISESAADAWFATAMTAKRDAKPQEGKFPLIIIGQGNFQSAHHQAILSEYIASHGYVVATTPSQTRISGPLTSEDQIFPSMEEQSRDMGVAIESFRNDPTVDIQQIGIVGHSFGARSAFLMLVRDPRVKALVSLDGGIANKRGKDWLQKLSSFDPLAVHTPILHFYQDNDDVVIPDFELLESMKNSAQVRIKLERMQHLYFTSLGMVTATISGFGPQVDQELKRKYEAICFYTLNFLDMVIKKHVRSSAVFDKQPEENGFSKKFITVKTIKAAR